MMQGQDWVGCPREGALAILPGVLPWDELVGRGEVGGGGLEVLEHEPLLWAGLQTMYAVLSSSKGGYTKMHRFVCELLPFIPVKTSFTIMICS